MKCLGKSEQSERIMDLTVEIDGDIGTLEEALAQFTATEILDGENKYWCSRLVQLACCVEVDFVFGFHLNSISMHYSVCVLVCNRNAIN